MDKLSLAAQLIRGGCLLAQAALFFAVMPQR
jgi:hypothetical protein